MSQNIVRDEWRRGLAGCKLMVGRHPKRQIKLRPGAGRHGFIIQAGCAAGGDCDQLLTLAACLGFEAGIGTARYLCKRLGGSGEHAALMAGPILLKRLCRRHGT